MPSATLTTAVEKIQPTAIIKLDGPFNDFHAKEVIGIIDDLLTMGKPNKKARPWLGLFCAEAEGAVVVAALTEGGPAHDADVEVGDIVRAVAGNEIGSLADFFRNIWSIGPAGVEVPLLIERDGEVLEIYISSVARSDMLKGPKLH